MHELGILYQALKTVEKTAKSAGIKKIKHISFELGTESECQEYYLKKLFPVAAEQFPFARGAELKVSKAPGRGVFVREIGY